MTGRARIADHKTCDLILFGPDLKILLEHRISGAPVVEAEARLISVLTTCAPPCMAPINRTGAAGLPAT